MATPGSSGDRGAVTGALAVDQQDHATLAVRLLAIDHPRHLRGSGVAGGSAQAGEPDRPSADVLAHRAHHPGPDLVPVADDVDPLDVAQGDVGDPGGELVGRGQQQRAVDGPGQRRGGQLGGVVVARRDHDGLRLLALQPLRQHPVRHLPPAEEVLVVLTCEQVERTCIQPPTRDTASLGAGAVDAGQHRDLEVEHPVAQAQRVEPDVRRRHVVELDADAVHRAARTLVLDLLEGVPLVVATPLPQRVAVLREVDVLPAGPGTRDVPDVRDDRPATELGTQQTEPDLRRLPALDAHVVAGVVEAADRQRVVGGQAVPHGQVVAATRRDQVQAAVVALRLAAVDLDSDRGVTTLVDGAQGPGPSGRGAGGLTLADVEGVVGLVDDADLLGRRRVGRFDQAGCG